MDSLLKSVKLNVGIVIFIHIQYLSNFYNIFANLYHFCRFCLTLLLQVSLLPSLAGVFSVPGFPLPLLLWSLLLLVVDVAGVLVVLVSLLLLRVLGLLIEALLLRKNILPIRLIYCSYQTSPISAKQHLTSDIPIAIGLGKS